MTDHAAHLAEAVLRAAGSSLRNYPTVTRTEIVITAQRHLSEILRPWEEARRAINNDCREVLEGRLPLSLDLIHGIAHGRLKSA